MQKTILEKISELEAEAIMLAKEYAHTKQTSLKNAIQFNLESALIEIDKQTNLFLYGEYKSQTIW